MKINDVNGADLDALALVSTRAIQNGAVTEPKLADNAVSKRAIQKGAVSIAQLLVELIVDNVEVSVPKAPGAGRFGQETVNIPGNGDEHAFYLISVHFVRFVTSQQSSTVDFDWKQRVTLTQNPLQPRVQELVIQNSNTDDGIIVSCKVYRLAEK